MAAKSEGQGAGITHAAESTQQYLQGVEPKGWNRAGYTLPTHEVFEAYMEQLRRFLGEDWNPQRIAKDGCGLPTVSNTVAELAKIYAGLVQDKDSDWIWEAMCKNPDLVGGFNRLDSTILKIGKGKVIAKEGADGLLGMAIEHPDYPEWIGNCCKNCSRLELTSNMVCL